MDPFLVELLEPVVAFSVMLGVAFGVKFLIWGKGPIRRVHRPAEHQALEQRVAELEERWEQLSEVIMRQADQIADHDERMDFAERMLTRQRAEEPKALENPEAP